MKQQNISHRAGRRNFFKKAALLGGTAALTVLGKQTRAETSPGRSKEPPTKGYRLTSHIRKYYQKASF